MIRTTFLPQQLQFGSLAIEVESFDDWRDAARKLIARRIAPDEVVWADRDGPQQMLLGMVPTTNRMSGGSHVDEAAHDSSRSDASPASAARIRVPKRFTNLAEHVACHRDNRRWDFLYRVLWRLTHDEPNLLEITTDDDVHALLQMEREVLRELDVMKSEIRFRRIGEGAGGHYVAWYRPEHRVLRLIVPFLQRRFGVMTWSVVTPDASIHWNGEVLNWSSGAALPANAEQSSGNSSPEQQIEQWWSTVGKPLVIGQSLHASTCANSSSGSAQGMLDLDGTSSDEVPLQLAKRTTKRRVLSTTSAEEYLPAETRDLDALREAARSCRGCELHQHATQTVFGSGPTKARIVIVGEQPGDYEDRRGKPFVGPAGKLLDEVLAEVGIDPSQVYVTNAVKHFKWTPRGKRRLHAKPSSREVGACRPWLEAELLTIKPQVLVCLGATAIGALLGSGHRVTDEHGQVFASEWAPSTIVTYHPSAILRASGTEQGNELRTQFVDDLRKVARLLKRRAR